LSKTKSDVNNPNVGTFEIITPDNKLFVVNYGIPKFLKIHSEYKIKKWVLYHAKRLGEYRDWKINKIK